MTNKLIIATMAYNDIYIEIQAQVNYSIKTKQDALLGLTAQCWLYKAVILSLMIMTSLIIMIIIISRSRVIIHPF